MAPSPQPTSSTLAPSIGPQPRCGPSRPLRPGGVGAGEHEHDHQRDSRERLLRLEVPAQSGNLEQPRRARHGRGDGARRDHRERSAPRIGDGPGKHLPTDRGVIFGALAEAFPQQVPAAANGATATALFAGTNLENGVPYAYLETLGEAVGRDQTATARTRCRFT